MRKDLDRCPDCRGPLTFEGIDNRMLWTRWTSCALCGTWVITDENGALLQSSKMAASKNQFLTGRALLNAMKADVQAKRVEEFM